LAWILRILEWFLLAFAWQRLSMAVIPRRGWAILSAMLLIAANERASMAGEWIVGGAEAKAFAYALVFLALWRLARNDWTRVWLLLGCATSMHPLVGGWAFAGAAFAWLTGPREALRNSTPVMIGVILALPGLWWGMALNAGTSPAVVHRAAEIMVLQRAPHHLLPAAFSTGHMLRQFGLWVVLGVLLVFGRPFPPSVIRLVRFGIAAMGIAAAGFLLAGLLHNRPDVQAMVLQYYWFRLSDAVVPAVLVLTAVFLLGRLRVSRPMLANALLVLGVILGTMHLADRTRRIQSATAPRADWMLQDPSSWREVCAWAAANTPDTACFLTPPGGATFQWYSNRKDVVNWKDVPQDAAGIVTWWERMRDIHGPDSPKGVLQARASLGELGGFRLRQLADEYDADYAIITRTPGLRTSGWPEVYSNASYSVVRLRTPAER